MHSMNGEKSSMKEQQEQQQQQQQQQHEFDSWRTPAPAHYQHSSNAPPMGASAQNSNSDPYAMSYYPTTPIFPYATDSGIPSSQPWSNGAETMTFLSGYTPEHNVSAQHSAHSGGHYTMEAMFGSQNTYGFGNAITSPFNHFFPSNSDPFWPNNTKPNRSVGPPGPAYRMHETPDSYNYHHDSYATTGAITDAQALKHMESGIAGLTLDHIKASEQFAGKSMSGPFSGSEPKKFEMSGGSGAVGQIPKKMTWASIASQPAKPQPKSLKSKMSSSVLTGSTSKHLPPTSMEAIGTWESKNGTSSVKTPPTVQTMSAQTPSQSRSASNSVALPQMVANQSNSWTAPRSGQQQQQMAAQTQGGNRGAQQFGVGSGGGVGGGGGAGVVVAGVESAPVPLPAHPVLDKLRVENNYNPKEFDLNPRNARFFIIKSYSEDDIHRSIKYSIWCSTEHGNKRLDNAFKQQETKGPIYLLFSVNGSGHFCGMAQMTSYVDYSSSSSVWAQDKWKGQFKVKWIYVKDVPNAQLRHIRLENNENKPVTNSRDTQEVPFEKGKQVIKIMHHFRHTTSIFDDFLHYEKRQEEEGSRRPDAPPLGSGSGSAAPPTPPIQTHPNSGNSVQSVVAMQHQNNGGGGQREGPGSGSGHRGVEPKRGQQWK